MTIFSRHIYSPNCIESAIKSQLTDLTMLDVFAAVVLCNCAARATFIRHCNCISSSSVGSYSDVFADIALASRIYL